MVHDCDIDAILSGPVPTDEPIQFQARLLAHRIKGACLSESVYGAATFDEDEAAGMIEEHLMALIHGQESTP